MELGLKELFSTKGRLGKREFLNLIVMLFIINKLINKGLEYVGNEYLVLGISIFATIIITYSTFILYIKRAHDFNKNWIVVIPKILIDIFIIFFVYYSLLGYKNFSFIDFRYLIGLVFIVFVIFLLIPGNKEKNKYGEVSIKKY